ncbi:unnamed protein product, partial [marine sediment metagenome]
FLLNDRLEQYELAEAISLTENRQEGLMIFLLLAEKVPLYLLPVHY